MPKFSCKPLIPVLLFLALFLPALRAVAGENRLLLASQSDFGGKRGFYLDFENHAPDGTPPKLTTLRLILGVADGKRWLFLDDTPVWRYSHDYHARAVIAPGHAELWLDGQKIKEAAQTLLPDPGEALTAGLIPDWAGAPAEYLLLEKSCALTLGGGKPLRVPVTDLTTLPPALTLFDPQAPAEVPFKPDPARTLTIDASFRIVPRPTDLRPLAPFVDKYGQPLAARYSGKVTSDAQLTATAADEARRTAAWGTPSGLDRWGGDARAGWHEAGTGYYHTVKRNGYWWLLTPLGNPCFYTGLCSAPALAWDKTPTTGRDWVWQSLPPRTGDTAAAWGKNAWGEGGDTDYFAPHSVNMARKYGPDWQALEKARTARRLQSWGFSGLGKWCDPLPGVPDVPVLGLGGIPKVARHPDVFDPVIQTAIRARLEKDITPRRADPAVVGWSIGNEYDEIITPGEIKDILAMPDGVPARRALLDESRAHLAGSDPAKFTDADLEHLRRFYAGHYYDFLYRTIKTIDPNHLYLGFWISIGWWVNDEDFRMIARHCDVVGYDRYSDSFADSDLARLMREAGKPVLCGEFSFPPTYNGARGFGVYGTARATDDADAGRQYGRWVGEAARNPACVGVCWFQYRDEPVTGRGPGHGPDLVYGEHYAFGLVDVTDTPKWDLVTRVRAENLAAPGRRLAAMRGK